jgi:hypothetical protein
MQNLVSLWVGQHTTNRVCLASRWHRGVLWQDPSDMNQHAIKGPRHAIEIESVDQ